MSDKEWFESFLTAIDGHTTVTLAEAEEILSKGIKPFDKFIAEVDNEMKERKVDHRDEHLSY